MDLACLQTTLLTSLAASRLENSLGPLLVKAQFQAIQWLLNHRIAEDAEEFCLINCHRLRGAGTKF